jgi:hypothetical protein
MSIYLALYLPNTISEFRNVCFTMSSLGGRLGREFVGYGRKVWSDIAPKSMTKNGTFREASAKSKMESVTCS